MPVTHILCGNQKEEGNSLPMAAKGMQAWKRDGCMMFSGSGAAGRCRRRVSSPRVQLKERWACPYIRGAPCSFIRSIFSAGISQRKVKGSKGLQLPELFSAVEVLPSPLCLLSVCKTGTQKSERRLLAGCNLITSAAFLRHHCSDPGLLARTLRPSLRPGCVKSGLRCHRFH